MSCFLGNIRIHIPILSLHIFFFNKPIDILLDIRHTKNTSLLCSFNNFHNQTLMSNFLLAFHDADNGGLCLEITIRLYAFVGLLVLFFRFLKLYLVDFDTVFLM
jgi:hypothetical protein